MKYIKTLSIAAALLAIAMVFVIVSQQAVSNERRIRLYEYAATKDMSYGIDLTLPIPGGEDFSIYLTPEGYVSIDTAVVLRYEGGIWKQYPKSVLCKTQIQQ